jgi:hypothetical protein
MCDGVTLVCVHKLQKLEDDCFGERALRSAELLRAKIPKRQFFPERGLKAPVQNLEVHQKFAFPKDSKNELSECKNVTICSLIT